MTNTTTIWKIPTGDFTHTMMAELNSTTNQKVWPEYKRLRDEGFIVSAGVRAGKGKPTLLWKVADGKTITTDATAVVQKAPKVVKPKPVLVVAESAVVVEPVKPIESETVEVVHAIPPQAVSSDLVEPAKAPKKEKVVEIPTPVEELRPVTQTAVLGEILETNFLCPFCKTKMLSQGRNGGVTVWCPVNDLKICSCSENPYGHSNNAKNAYEIACEKFKHV